MTTKTRSSFFRRDDSKAAPATEHQSHESRPARSFNKPDNRSDRPARSFDKSDRPARSFDKSDRPARSFDRSDRPARSFDRSDRPARSFDKSDRPARSFDRSDRPARSFDKSDRPARSFDRSDRPARSFDKSDRPARSFDRSDRPARSFDKSDRPARSFDRSDRPARSFDKSDRPARSFDKSDRPARSFDRSDRPARSFDKSDRPARSFDNSDRPSRPSKFGQAQVTDRVEREDRPTKRNESFAPRIEKTKNAPYAPPKTAELPAVVRLNRFIAQSGICSRREADELIKNGEVMVNDIVVAELGTKVDTRTDVVKYDGKPLSGEKLVYLIMNKPKGYVTTTEDPHAEQTVIDLLKGQVRERVYPVGRLDKNTTGVLLLTNDGDLTRELTHPSFEKRKIYHVFLDKPVTEEDLQKLATGVELEDGIMIADQVSYVDGNRKEVGVEIHSGRNRIVRRMFESMDYKVIKLDRVYFAGFTKEGLRRGFWRALTAREVASLKSGQYK